MSEPLEPPPSRYSPAELSNAIRLGTRGVVLAQAGSQVVSLVITALLYRLLSPSDFGLVAMVVPWVLLLRMLTSQGLAVATVRAAELDAAAAAPLFWGNLGAALLGAALSLAAAPLLAWGYGQPAVQPIAALLAGTGIVAALGSQHAAMAERQLRLGPLAAVRLGAQTGGGLAAVAWALLAGRGPWVLVAQQYFELALLALGAWWVVPWWPRWPRDWRPLRAAGAFSGLFTAANAGFFLGQNLDKVLVGWWLGPTSAGLYTQAFNLMMRPVYLLTTPLAGVLLPALARVADQPAMFNRVLLAFDRLVTLVCFPAAVGLALVADEAMIALGGPQWAPAGPILRALAPVVALQPLVNLAGSVLAAAGKAGRLVLAAGLFTVVVALAVTLGVALDPTARYGPLAIAWAYALGVGWVFALPYLAWTRRAVGNAPLKALAGVLPAARAALLMGVCVAVVRWLLLISTRPTAWLLLAVELTVGLVSYGLLSLPQWRWCWRQWPRPQSPRLDSTAER